MKGQVLQTKPSTGNERVRLYEIAWAFLKLGTVAFGGPAAHIALMEEEFVRQRKWLTQQEFLDRLGAANLIPGPSSTEMAIYIGFTKRGWPGLIVAGSCFIIPAAILVTAIAAIYMRYGHLPRVAGVLYAVKAVVVAVIVQAFWKLARTAVKSWWLAAIGVVAAILSSFDQNNLLVLMSAAVLAALPLALRSQQSRGTVGATFLLSRLKYFKSASWPILAGAAGAAAVPFSMERLFFTFVKIGSVLFGSGYVLLAFLRSDFVTRLHWLTEQQVLDAVAVGQVTPGPVFTTATFIGFVVGGPAGAAVATVAIFLPGFLFVAASGRVIPQIRRSRVAGTMLDGVIVGSLALMGVVTWHLGRAALADWMAWSIAIVSVLLLVLTRLNAVWLIAIAAIAGLFQR